MASLSSFGAALKRRKQKTVRSRLERLLWYAAIYDLLFIVLRFLLRSSRWSGVLDSTVYVFSFAVVLALFLIGVRWFNRKVLWRLRNRLIVTYIFIGVIPVVLLVTIGLTAAYLFAGQFATFVVSVDLQSELKALNDANTALADSLVAQVRSGMPPARAFDALRPVPGTTLTAWLQTPSSQSGAQSSKPPMNPAAKRAAKPPDASSLRSESFVLPAGSDPAAITPMLGGSTDLKVVAGTGHGLALRAASVADVNGARLIVISSRAFDTAELDTMAADLGEATLYAPDLNKNVNPKSVASDSSVHIDLGDSSNGKSSKESAKEGDNAKQQGSTTQPSANSGSIRISNEQGRNVVYLSSSDKSELVEALPPIVAGSLPPPDGLFDREVVFATPLEIVDWKTGKSFNALLKVRTRPSLLYHRLFVMVGEFAEVTFIALAAVAVVFAGSELIALMVGFSLTRTITQSVAALYDATQHINRGDFRHRIAIKSQDQLASLEDSFNTMSASIEQLIAEQKEKQRMESELAIAREVQAQLFPNQVPLLASLELFGVCRPARTVSGDYYDFLPLGAEKLGIAVGDISGKGISAALLMATIHSAVRVYDFGRLPAGNLGRLDVQNGAAIAVTPESAKSAAAGADVAMDSVQAQTVQESALQSPATVMRLLNHHLFQSTPPEKYATLFLALWDGDSHTLTYCNAGHLAPIIMAPDGSVRKLDVGGTVVGLFDNVSYQQTRLKLAPGDLLIAYSDGITEPENEFCEFGEPRLLDLVRAHRDQPLDRISDAVISGVQDWIGPNPPPDDVTLVLARAR